MNPNVGIASQSGLTNLNRTNSIMNQMGATPDRFGCYANTIKVALGHYVDMVSPDPNSIDIFSISAALSKICRFGGHCPKFYSVAEHSVHAVTLAMKDLQPEDVLRAILLHDASEAYVGDMVKPLKLTMPQYVEAELRFERAIEQAFEVSLSSHHETIKHYDRAMLKAEKIAMWPQDSEEWQGFSEIDSRDVKLRYWLPGEAQRIFLKVSRSVGLVK